MRRRLKQAALVFLAVCLAAQFVRPSRANPPFDPSHTIQAQAGIPSGLGAVLDRGCGDCHSNQTVWPSFTQVAPLSWLMAYGVKQGRKAVNFSEWSAYEPNRQRELLVESCRDASRGKMPGGLYTTLRPLTRLSAKDVETICAAAGQTGADAASPREGGKP